MLLIRPMFQDLINHKIPQYKVYHALITPSLKYIITPNALSVSLTQVQFIETDFKTLILNN